jgi:antitoxin component of MazEF toxin-antitoxin module
MIDPIVHTKIVQLQEQLALPLPADLIARMGWNEDTLLDVTVESGKLFITPVTDEKRKQEFREALEAVNRRHGETLRRLAEYHLHAREPLEPL